ncbi:MAG TPA: glycosyltransferase family 9 protein, partial [Gemmatimonadales bacterium]|nr:glycosyltransferase family 9 protein [Gemmatimonadales bacterium]
VAAADWLVRQGVSGEFVAVAPGSVWAARRWPHFAALAAAIIERALALVTNDSAALHLATAVGTPIIALFGPTTPSFGFGPLGPRDVVLGLDDLLCRPCAQPGPAACPLEHHRCLCEIDVAIVAAALTGMVQAEEAGRAVRSRH